MDGPERASALNMAAATESSEAGQSTPSLTTAMLRNETEATVAPPTPRPTPGFSFSCKHGGVLQDAYCLGCEGEDTCSQVCLNNNWMYIQTAKRHGVKYNSNCGLQGCDDFLYGKWNSGVQYFVYKCSKTTTSPTINASAEASSHRHRNATSLDNASSQEETPNPQSAINYKRCTPNTWLNHFNPDPADCLSIIQGRSYCSQEYFNHATHGDGNCGCVGIGTNCSDAVQQVWDGPVRIYQIKARAEFSGGRGTSSPDWQGLQKDNSFPAWWAFVMLVFGLAFVFIGCMMIAQQRRYASSTKREMARLTSPLSSYSAGSGSESCAEESE